MTRIASRVSQLNGEGALAVYSRAKELERLGRSVIHLELGEPDFHPAAPVVDAVRAAVAAGRDRYCATRGLPNLREAIAGYLKRTRRLDVASEQVLVAPGCKRSEEHTSELQSRFDLVCRLLLEKKKKINYIH